MVNKTDRFYFDNFIDAAECSCKAANYLVKCLENYDLCSVETSLAEMHELEHAGDKKKHEMSTALAKAFVTPLDREDLAEISQNIDEVTDMLEEVMQRFYINRLASVTPEAIEFAKKIAGCCCLMKDLLVEFEHFKKSKRLHSLIVDVNNAEEDCDRFYLEAAKTIQEKGGSVLEIISWREIYNFMEDCADACEHVADAVETIIMKNT